jgi:hypothetical protein
MRVRPRPDFLFRLRLITSTGSEVQGEQTTSQFPEVQCVPQARRHQPQRQTFPCLGKTMIRLCLVLLPELRQFPPERQDEALRIAGDSALEPLELIGVAVWLVPVVTLAKYLLGKASLTEDAFATLVMNLLVIVPLLGAVFAPIHIRRLRRGLRQQLTRQEQT